jgi:hypothetical protein
MWVVRELLRLVGRIAIAVLVAIVIAEVRAVITGGDTFHTFRIVLMLLGALYLLLAAGPGASLDGRVGRTPGWLGWNDLVPAGDQDPHLTATATFVGSGLAVLALGVFL